MTERAALIIFESSWSLLLFIAILAQILFEDKPQRQAGTITNLLVIIPFVVVTTPTQGDFKDGGTEKDTLFYWLEN